MSVLVTHSNSQKEELSALKTQVGLNKRLSIFSYDILSFFSTSKKVPEIALITLRCTLDRTLVIVDMNSKISRKNTVWPFEEKSNQYITLCQ